MSRKEYLKFHHKNLMMKPGTTYKIINFLNYNVAILEQNIKLVYDEKPVCGLSVFEGKSNDNITHVYTNIQAENGNNDNGNNNTMETLKEACYMKMFKMVSKDQLSEVSKAVKKNNKDIPVSQYEQAFGFKWPQSSPRGRSLRVIPIFTKAIEEISFVDLFYPILFVVSSSLKFLFNKKDISEYLSQLQVESFTSPNNTLIYTPDINPHLTAVLKRGCVAANRILNSYTKDDVPRVATVTFVTLPPNPTATAPRVELEMLSSRQSVTPNIHIGYRFNDDIMDSANSESDQALLRMEVTYAYLKLFVRKFFSSALLDGSNRILQDIVDASYTLNITESGKPTYPMLSKSHYAPILAKDEAAELENRKRENTLDTNDFYRSTW